MEVQCAITSKIFRTQLLTETSDGSMILFGQLFNHFGCGVCDSGGTIRL